MNRLASSSRSVLQREIAMRSFSVSNRLAASARTAAARNANTMTIASSTTATTARRGNRSFVTASAPRLSATGRAPLPPTPRVPPPKTQVQKSTAGTGHKAPEASPGLYARTKDRGPVSWPSLFLVTVAAASAVAYYRIEREKRLEKAMGKIVSSESDGWTPRPDYLAKRKFKATPWGWFPVEDGFGARECLQDNIFVRIPKLNTSLTHCIAFSLSLLSTHSRKACHWRSLVARRPRR